MAACARVPWSKILKNQRRCCQCWKNERYLSSQQSDVARAETPVPKGQVTMPKKKKRDSLSILKALASTVEPVKGPSYQEIDDPYLLTTKPDQLTCYLSKASGQKTARYFVNKYRSAFEHEEMAPFVPSFQPDAGDYEFGSLGEEAIRERLARREVRLAAEIYTKMKQQDMSVSEEVKLELLEMMCMFDSQDPPAKPRPLELVIGSKPEPAPTEMAACLQAQEVFDDLAEKTAEAHNWLLQGLLIEDKIFEATAVYKDMKQKAVQFEQTTYHLLLHRASILYNMDDGEYSKVFLWQQAILREMEAARMRPSQATLHGVILGLQRRPFDFLNVWPDLLAEMKRFNIEPDYEAWSLAARAMLNCTPLGNKKDCVPGQHHMDQVRRYLREAIQHLKSHPQDVYCMPTKGFFNAAMNICYYVEDSELALHVHEFRESLGSRHVTTSLIEDRYYYVNLLDVLVKKESCDKVMEIYNKTFGHGWYEDEAVLRVLSSVSTFKASQYLPELFEDYMQRQKMPSSIVLETFFSMMAHKQHDQELKQTFHEQANYIFGFYKQFFEDDRKPPVIRNPPSWAVAVNMIKVFLNYDDLDKAWATLLLADKYQADIDLFTWRPELMPLIKAIIDARDQEKIEKFVSLANSSWSFVVDIEAFRPKLELFMSPDSIEALKKRQASTTSAKYGL